MNTSSNDIITSLDNKIDFIDKAVWFAVAISVILGGSLFFYKSKLTAEQKKEIKAQQERIALIESNAAVSRQEAAEANKKAAEANERAADANQKAEEAKINAEQERIKRLELQKALSPREIDIDKLAREISEFRDYEIIVNYLVDTETVLLVKQFKNAIAKANLKTSYDFIVTSPGEAADFFIGVKIIGIFNQLEPNDPLNILANKIKNHFDDCNIKSQLLHLPGGKYPNWLTPIPKELSSKTIMILFGIKPLTNFEVD